MATLEIELMREADLDVVWEIERASFSMPLSRQAFARELTLPMSRLRVARQGNSVVGFLNYWVVHEEVHIMTIAVTPASRRDGVGKALFEFMLSETQGFASYHLELRRSNLPALAFYQKYGFEICGVRKHYYADNQEDALLMSRYEKKGKLTTKIVEKKKKLFVTK